MNSETSKLALFFYGLAAISFIWIAYSVVQAYSSEDRHGAELVMYGFPNIIYQLVNPAFCLLAGRLSQYLKDAASLLEQHVAWRGQEGL